MAEQILRIPRASDRTVFNFYKKLAKKYNVSNVGMHAFGVESMGSIDVLASPLDDTLVAILKQRSAILYQCAWGLNGFSVIYYRGGKNRDSSIYDEIVISQSNKANAPSDEEIIDIVSIINRDLKVHEPGRSIETGISKEQAELQAINQAHIERLADLGEDVIRKGNEQRANLDKEFTKRASALQRKLDTKESRLDESFQEKLDDIETREKILKDQLNTIDNRDNTIVRRAIRDTMLNDVKDRISEFGVSKETTKKRLPVAMGMALMAIILALMLVYTVTEIRDFYYVPGITSSDMPVIAEPVKAAGDIKLSLSSPILYFLWFKVSALFLGLLATVLFYTKWEMKWAERYADSEFQLQQFHIDVNRANWVIESCLEWSKENSEAEIPDELLESITRNLFKTDADNAEQVLHPSDQLASALMGRASNLKLKLGENELCFDEPGKIKKAIS